MRERVTICREMLDNGALFVLVRGANLGDNI
jgi:hypothetical protein